MKEDNMKKNFFNLCFAFLSLLSNAANLLVNPEFKGSVEDIGLWAFPAGTNPNTVKLLPGKGPSGENVLSIDFSGCSRVLQTGFRLVAGERYRIGGLVRTSNFIKAEKNVCSFYVNNTNWEKDVKAADFPKNTNEQWVRVERDVVMPESKDGLYTFSIFGAGSIGRVEVCHPYLIPLTETAGKGSSAPHQYTNLLRNPEFRGTDDNLGIWNCNLGRYENTVKLLPGEGPGGKNALFINLPVCGQFKQMDIRLAAGEKYRLGGWVRTKDFKSPKNSVSAFYVCNYGWTKDVKTLPFPEDTKGKWVHLEREIVAPESKTGYYCFTIYGAKTSGRIEVCNPYLIPTTEKGEKGSAPAHQWENDLPRVMPYYPLLSKVSAKTGEILFCTVYPVEGAFSDYLCRVSYAGKDSPFSKPKDFSFDDEGLSRAELGSLPEGKGRIRVEMVRKSDNKVILSNEYSMTAVIPLSNGKRLNNFVTELFHGDLENREYTFIAPDDGWFRVAFSIPQKDACGYLDSDSIPVVVFHEGEVSETMRFLKRGKHMLRVEKSVPGAKLTISKVPQIPIFPFSIADRNYYDKEERKHQPFVTGRPGFIYDTAFARKYLWHSFNTYFMNNIWNPKTAVEKASDTELKQRGFDILACEGFETKAWSNAKIMEEDIYKSDSIRTTSGRCLDETAPNASMSVLTALTNLGWNLLGYDKIIHVWMDVQFGCTFSYPAIHRPLIAACSNVSQSRGKLLMETYVCTKPNRQSMEAYFSIYPKQMQIARKCIPNAPERFMYIIGGYQIPGIWCANCYPQTDMKYFLDAYFHLISTDTECDGLAGVGCYGIRYSDEEMMRWISLLFHHYCVNGKTEMLSDRYGFSLNPGHLDNCDFENGLKGWTSEPAEHGSIAPHTIRYLGKEYECRRVIDAVTSGDTCVLFTHSIKAPNRLSRKITGLKPGKLYSLMFVTVDPEDIENPKNIHQTIVLHATLNGATVLPELGYDFRAGGNEFQKSTCEIQTQKIVFRADKEDVLLTFSDWKNDTEPGNPSSKKRIMNFVSVLPYFVAEIK